MATKKEINEHLRIAIKEIGTLDPWYNKSYKCWIFSHSAYPVEYAGESKEEVIQNYPLYLRDFIEERLNNNLSPSTEKRTKGRGGKRGGAGRPLGSKKEAKKRVYLPVDIAEWIKQPDVLPQVRQLMCKEK